MKAVVQRVKYARLSINGELYSSIGQGFMTLIGIHENDDEHDLAYVVKKLTGLRVFEDENEKMNLSLDDIGGELMLVSQFTLYGDTSHGNRPSFIEAARPEKAIPLYEAAIAQLREKLGTERVKTGVFGADMQIELQNDGPVTILIDSSQMKGR